jgi:hypothetical protein
MRTDDLIRALTADHASRAQSVTRYLARVLVPAFAVAALLLVGVIGLRPDISASLGDPRFAFKFVVTLSLAATAIAASLRLAEPGVDVRPWLYALAIAPLLLLAGVLVELATIDPATRAEKLIGQNWAYCLAYIPLLSLPLLVAALFGLRHGAPTRPVLAGAVAGLLAGGIGAALYAAHCVDDSPLFVAAWYSAGIGLVTAAGAMAGGRFLRW